MNSASGCNSKARKELLRGTLEDIIGLMNIEQLQKQLNKDVRLRPKAQYRRSVVA